MIYNGIIDQDKPNIVKDKDLEEVREWKDSGFKIFGCIGTVCERKNQALLLEAIRKTDNTTDFRFVFIGEGDLLEDLKDRTIEYKLQDRIRFYGYKQNAEDYLKLLDCLILPSKSEGFGMVIVEAFREKVPVIASDINPFKELIMDRQTGILFKLDCVNELVIAINKMIFFPDSEKQLMVRQAYNAYQRRFKFDIMKEKYMDLYSELLQR